MDDAFESALLGVHLNGVAGNLAFRQTGLHMVATDLLDAIPGAMKPYDKIR
jgi:NAD(P)H-hydrate epimerase